MPFATSLPVLGDRRRDDAIALAFVLPRLLARRAPRDDAVRGAINVTIYRSQLAELDGDLARPPLSAEQHRDARLDLERRLLAEADVDDRAGATATTMPRTAIALTLALPLAAFALYACSETRRPCGSSPRMPHVRGDERRPGVVRDELTSIWRAIPAMPRLGAAGPPRARERPLREAADAFGRRSPRRQGRARPRLVRLRRRAGMSQGGSLEGKPRELIARAWRSIRRFRGRWRWRQRRYERRDFAGAAGYWRRCWRSFAKARSRMPSWPRRSARAERLAATPAVPLGRPGLQRDAAARRTRRGARAGAADLATLRRYASPMKH